MQNATKEFTTVLGHKVVIKAFLTYNDLEPTLGIEDTVAKSNKIMEIAIVSIDDSTDAPYNALRALPVSEYMAVSKEVTAILNGGFTPAK